MLSTVQNLGLQKLLLKEKSISQSRRLINKSQKCSLSEVGGKSIESVILLPLSLNACEMLFHISTALRTCFAGKFSFIKIVNQRVFSYYVCKCIRCISDNTARKDRYCTRSNQYFRQIQY